MGDTFEADAHGCDLDKGETWCKGKCVDEYARCDPGTWSINACTYSWAGLSWDLTPLQRESHYVVRDVQAHHETAYTIAICRDVEPTSVAESQ